MTTEPSPTADATRFTEPLRTSPTAKMPAPPVANGLSDPSPARTNPLASSATDPFSHPVQGSAPIMTNRPRAATSFDAPVAWFVMVMLSRLLVSVKLSCLGAQTDLDICRMFDPIDEVL